MVKARRSWLSEVKKNKCGKNCIHACNVFRNVLVSYIKKTELTKEQISTQLLIQELFLKDSMFYNNLS